MPIQSNFYDNSIWYFWKLQIRAIWWCVSALVLHEGKAVRYGDVLVLHEGKAAGLFARLKKYWRYVTDMLCHRRPVNFRTVGYILSSAQMQ